MKVIPPQEKFFSFRDSERFREFFLKASEVFNQYRFIMLPSLELYSQELYGDNPFVVGSCEDGSLLCLRKDWTVSLARFLSLQKDLDLPLRVFYWGNVFSPSGSLEAYQVGVEFIGEPSLEAEVEILQLIGNYLLQCGVQELTVSLGHVSIVEELLREYGEAYRTFILQKNFSALASVEPLKDILMSHGGEEVLDHFCNKYPKFSSYCNHLKEVGRGLQNFRVVFDLSEIRPKPYYTGLVFEFFGEGVGQPLAGGGRYDKLYKNLGRDICAVGGAVYIDLLLDV